jgi:hypothetical protein
LAKASGGMMPVTARPVASPVSSMSFPPAPSGMNVAQPANEIADTEAVYLQDILLDQPGWARRRGPVTAAPAVSATLPRKAMGIAMAIDPQGSNRFGVFTGTGAAGYFTLLNSALSGSTDITWPYALGTAPYPIVNAGTGLLNGTFIGTATAYDSNSPSEALAYWMGGIYPAYSTGTLTITRGSTSVVGSGTSFTTNVSPGMWLFANTTDPYTSALVGVVKTVVDATHLTLAAPSPYAVSAGAYTLQPLRGVIPKVNAGAITIGSGSAQVNGGNTKFLKQGLNTGNWDIYRASDMAWVGTVLSVQSDISLTLKANATISLADDAYVAIRADADQTIPITQGGKPGFLTAIYSNRQWYANNGGNYQTVYRLWFSDESDPEILDMSYDGNWIPINSTGDIQEPIVRIAPAYNTLVISKETETFGLYGNDPSNFDVMKIADDGTLSGMSMQTWGGGVIWAGRQGIHFYDGTQDMNLTVNKFGNVWRQLVTTFDPTQSRMWSLVERNHYILHIENVSPPIALVKGNVSSTPDHWVVVINMDTQAVTLFQNVKMRGSVTLPATQGRESWYVYNDGTKGVVAEASAFFDIEGNDPAVEGVSNAGPDFYFVSKKMDGGDPTRLKRFTYFILTYLAQGDAVEVDTVLGQNNIGSTLSTTFPATVPTWSTISQSITTWTGLKNQFADWAQIVSSVFLPNRLRFLKKSQLMQFRLWQASSNVTRLKIANFEVGFKSMRAGRI